MLAGVQEVRQYVDEGAEYLQEGVRLVRMRNVVSRRVEHLVGVPLRGGVEHRAQLQHRSVYLLGQVQQRKSVRRKSVTTAEPRVI